MCSVILTGILTVLSKMLLYSVYILIDGLSSFPLACKRYGSVRERQI